MSTASKPLNTEYSELDSVNQQREVKISLQQIGYASTLLSTIPAIPEKVEEEAVHRRSSEDGGRRQKGSGQEATGPSSRGTGGKIGRTVQL